MADYYAILTKKIKESSDDPARLRQVVYEAARLALRWQVEQQWPRLSIDKSKRHISELEDAISRLEAVAAGAGGAPGPELSEAAGGLKASQQRRDEPIESEGDDVSDTLEEWHPQNPLSAEEAGLAAVAGSLSERDNRVPSSAAGLKAGRQSGEALIEPEVECAPQTFEAPISQPRHPPSAEWGGREMVTLSGSNREPENATASLNASGESHNALAESEEDDAPDTAERLSNASRPSREEDDVSYSREKPRPQPPDPPPTEVTGPDAVGEGPGRKAAAGFRQAGADLFQPRCAECSRPSRWLRRCLGSAMFPPCLLVVSVLYAAMLAPLTMIADALALAAAGPAGEAGRRRVLGAGAAAFIAGSILAGLYRPARAATSTGAKGVP